jgi:hypothetical protein
MAVLWTILYAVLAFARDWAMVAIVTILIVAAIVAAGAWWLQRHRRELETDRSREEDDRAA